ncbi:hypothetical protein CI238_07286 [Colletotrichum incanum]|uniref:Uncharacterized protein n=1 Tax=Colletotrichum incanum TaxID=1573173 RepID=A0A167AE44_COLIC|nr:hypothetical protein CI238_07286 [Colletotrichum incanum]
MLCLLGQHILVVQANLLADVPHNLLERQTCRTIRETIEEAFAVVARHTNAWIQRHAPQKRHPHLLGQCPPAARCRPEDLALVRTLGTDETRHVLRQAQHADARLAAEVDLLADVKQRDLLRRRDDDGAVDAAVAEERVDAEVLVAGPRRRVDQQEIEGPPLNVLQKLLDETVLLGATPDNGGVTVRQHELDRHDAEVVEDPDGGPSRAGDVDRLGLDAEHLGDRGPADVRVHDADAAVRVCGEGVGEEGGEGGLADAALAGEDEDLVGDGGEARGDDGNVRVWTFCGCRGANLLVWASGTGVSRTCRCGLGAGTVFWFRGDEGGFLF